MSIEKEEKSILERFKNSKVFNEENWINLAKELNEKLSLGIKNLEKRCRVIYKSMKHSLEKNYSYAKVKMLVHALMSTAKSNGKLIKVEILEGRNIFQAKKNGLSDSMVVIEFQGYNGRIISKRENTNIIKDTLFPNWQNDNSNNIFYFPLVEDSEMISFTCYHKEMLKSKVFLGEIVIPLQSIINEKVEDWFALKTNSSKVPVTGDLRINIETINCDEEEIINNTSKRDFKKIISEIEKKVVGSIELETEYIPDTKRFERYLYVGRVNVNLDKESKFYLKLTIINSNGNELRSLEITGNEEDKIKEWTFIVNHLFSVFPNTYPTLEISVWESHLVFSNQLIGRIEIEIEQLTKNKNTKIKEEIIAPLSGDDIDTKFIQKLIEEGKKPVYPIMIVPGLASSSLEVVDSKVNPSWNGERVWISILKLGNEVLTIEKMKDSMKEIYNVGAKTFNKVGGFFKNLGKSKKEEENDKNDNIKDNKEKQKKKKKGNLWVKHVKLNKSDGFTDPKGIIVRPVQDLSGVEFLSNDLFASSASYVMGPLIKNLRKFGYTDQNLAACPYDWRLAHSLVEKRDKFFSSLKGKIEKLYSDNNNTPVVVMCHSMGNRTFLYFLNWMHHHFPNDGQTWIDTHIHTFLAVGAPFLGASKAIKASTVGDRLGLESLLNEEEGIKFGNTLSSGPGLLPISHSYHFESDPEELKSFCYFKVSRNNSDDILSSYLPISVPDIIKKCGSDKMMNWFSNYFLNDPIFGGKNDPNNIHLEDLRISKAPPVKRLVHIYGINLDTQVKYLFTTHKDENNKDKVVLSGISGVLKNGYVVKSGIVYETKSTIQASIERNFGTKGKKSGDGTVSYASLNYSSTWKGQIEQLKHVEIDGAEHREILNSRLFFKNVIDVLSGNFNYTSDSLPNLPKKSNSQTNEELLN